MLLPDPLQRVTVLYHFTDRRNVASIREQGGLYPLATLREKGVAISAPGGNEWSHQADSAKGLDRYVHLCFRATHPMEYRARQEGRIVDSIFLLISAEVLQWEGAKFTPDVSNKSGVESYTMEQARSMIDFEVLYTRTDWRDSAIKQRLVQAEKYEILVPRHIPLELIRNLPSG
jgi:hypothetical protein